VCLQSPRANFVPTVPYGQSIKTEMLMSPSTPDEGGGKVGDINRGQRVDVADLSLLLNRWSSADAAADLNKDGTVGLTDLSLLLNHWESV